MLLRQIYVPELIMRLHVALVDSRKLIPGYVSAKACLGDLIRYRTVKLALELVNIVADSRHRLAEDFIGDDKNRLRDYLGAVRSAVLAGLENGGSDPFRVLITS